MDPALHDKIKNKLRKFLNREPSEAEIQNGQTDSILMHWIAQDDAATAAADQASVKADIAALKKAAKLP